MFSRMFIAALFLISKEKELGCPAVGEPVNTLIHSHDAMRLSNKKT